jgi:predicted RNA polymerase sigma factor
MDQALLRGLTPGVLGILVRRGADFAAAEDAVQDALIEALRVWPADPPHDPKGWLVTAAWRRFLDATRADAARRRREDLVDEQPAPGPAPAVDDTLWLYFLCAHPALTPSSAVALTLRAVGGLTTRQIAQAYLVPEATMAQRISRAKRTVSSVRLDQPGDVATVLRVLYLVFNEGYSGDLDLAAEAIRLTRQLAAAIDHPEVAGLLALMLLHHARRAGRTAPDGSLVPLAGRTAAGGTPRRSPRASRSCRRPWPATASASSRPRPPSRPCTPTRPPPRRPTGCRSSSGTTNSCG